MVPNCALLTDRSADHPARLRMNGDQPPAAARNPQVPRNGVHRDVACANRESSVETLDGNASGGIDLGHQISTAQNKQRVPQRMIGGAQHTGEVQRRAAAQWHIGQNCARPGWIQVIQAIRGIIFVDHDQAAQRHRDRASHRVLHRDRLREEIQADAIGGGSGPVDGPHQGQRHGVQHFDRAKPFHHDQPARIHAGGGREDGQVAHFTDIGRVRGGNGHRCADAPRRDDRNQVAPAGRDMDAQGVIGQEVEGNIHVQTCVVDGFPVKIDGQVGIFGKATAQQTDLTAGKPFDHPEGGNDLEEQIRVGPNDLNVASHGIVRNSHLDQRAVGLGQVRQHGAIRDVAQRIDDRENNLGGQIEPAAENAQSLAGVGGWLGGTDRSAGQGGGAELRGRNEQRRRGAAVSFHRDQSRSRAGGNQDVDGVIVGAVPASVQAGVEYVRASEHSRVNDRRPAKAHRQVAFGKPAAQNLESGANQEIRSGQVDIDNGRDNLQHGRSAATRQRDRAGHRVIGHDNFNRRASAQNARRLDGSRANQTVGTANRWEHYIGIRIQRSADDGYRLADVG